MGMKQNECVENVHQKVSNFYYTLLLFRVCIYMTHILEPYLGGGPVE